mmetsp:Transcript_83759/g.260270  ORF Transcript_83759/g.260270 Transcript_83759/m.260270 type:complete len:272 (+) Transcript_83759:1148-1963(+)
MVLHALRQGGGVQADAGLRHLQGLRGGPALPPPNHHLRRPRHPRRAAPPDADGRPLPQLHRGGGGSEEPPRSQADEGMPGLLQRLRRHAEVHGALRLHGRGPERRPLLQGSLLLHQHDGEVGRQVLQRQWRLLARHPHRPVPHRGRRGHLRLHAVHLRVLPGRAGRTQLTERLLHSAPQRHGLPGGGGLLVRREPLPHPARLGRRQRPLLPRRRAEAHVPEPPQDRRGVNRDAQPDQGLRRALVVAAEGGRHHARPAPGRVQVAGERKARC